MWIANGTTVLAISVLVPAMLCSAAGGKTIYVNDDATGANDGSSWADAYNYLQDALADANSAGKPVEIRVAQGIYKPDQGGGITPGDREATFGLINGVSLKGGYAALREQEPNAREISLYETILSGDLNGDDMEVTDPCDLLTESTRSDNSLHVVTGIHLTDETTILDGFTVSGGNSNRSSPWPRYPQYNPDGCGGGLYNFCAAPTVTNCSFRENSAYCGGGMFNESSNLPVNNCLFSENSAQYGGGMYNMSGEPILSECTMTGNRGSNGGGGVYNYLSSPILADCSFIGNLAGSGGGIYNDAEEGKCNPTFTNCTFRGNLATGYSNGGGMYNSGRGDIFCTPKLEECTFVDNSAGSYGGGMYNSTANPIVKKCTFSNNSAGAGGGISNYYSDPTLTDCMFHGNSAATFGGGGGMVNYHANPALANCTFTANLADWGGGMANGYSSPVLTNCTFGGNVARGWIGSAGGMSNSNSNPTLTNCTFSRNEAELGGGMYNNDSRPILTNCILWRDTPEEINGSAPVIAYSNVQVESRGPPWPGEGNVKFDPLFIDPSNGDYHLKSKAGKYDPNSRSWIRDDVTSLCIDAGDPNSPIGHEPFPNGGIVNMGAYGATAEASKSYFGEPVCETVVAGDINGDCKVDFSDFAIMALHWLDENNL